MEKGDQVIGAVYKSECGRYLCRPVGSWGRFEAWTADGSIHWRRDDRVKTWADAKKRRHPYQFCTGGFSAEEMGQKAGSFTVILLQCNQKKFIKPGTGNTVIERIDVVFRRKVPPQNYPRWLRGTNAGVSRR